MSTRFLSFAPGDPPPPPPAAATAAGMDDARGMLARYGGVRADDGEAPVHDRARLSVKPSHAIVIILILVGALATSMTLLVQQSVELAAEPPASAASGTPASGTAIPQADQAPVPDAVSPSPVPPSATVEDDPRIDLNTADQAALETIKGIGPVTAANILDYRARVGRFSSVDELVNVTGIGAKTLEKIREHVTVR